VLADRVWIHDTESSGVRVSDALGPASLSFTRSLIERARRQGVVVAGGATAAVSVEATVVRDSREILSDGSLGRGIELINASGPAEGAPDDRPSLTIRGSLVERNRVTGIMLWGADAIITDSVVRDTQPNAVERTSGEGIHIVEYGAPSRFELSGLVVAGNRLSGLVIQASDGSVENTVVRDTMPREIDQAYGRGVAIQRNPEAARSAQVVLRHSLIERQFDVGFMVIDSAVTATGLLVRDTVPNADEGLFGDGVAVSHYDATPGVTGSLELTASRVENAARAGIANFGCTVELSSTQVRCNAIDLNGEASMQGGAAPFLFIDGGGNGCGCGAEPEPCAAVSAGLAPPPAVP
jgi:hypothetical protein